MLKTGSRSLHHLMANYRLCTLRKDSGSASWAWSSLELGIQRPPEIGALQNGPLSPLSPKNRLRQY
jgi:hypothetical protein